MIPRGATLALVRSGDLKVSMWAGVALLATLLAQPLLAPLESHAFDARLRLRHDGGWPAGLVLVPINDATMKEHGRWPWPRETLAALIGAVEDAGAKTVILDAIPGSPTNAKADDALASVLSRVVLPVSFEEGGGEATIPATVRRSLVSEPRFGGRSMRADQIVAPMDVFVERAAGLGHVLIYHAPEDGKVRGHLPFFGIEGTDLCLPSLPLAGLMRFEDLDPARVKVTRNRLTLPDGRAVPLHGSALYLDLVPGGAMPPSISANEVFDHAGDGTLSARLSGKLALIYVDSVASPDTHPSPLSPVTPGGLLLAYAVRTIDRGRQPSPVAALPLLVLLAAIAAGFAPRLVRLPPERVLAIGAGGAAALAALSIALVPLADLFLPAVAPPALLLASGGIFSWIAGRNAAEERQKLQALLRASTVGTGAEKSGDKPTTALGPEETHAPGEGPTVQQHGPPPEPREPRGHALAEPVTIGRFTVQRKLGKGGMGAIFLAKDAELDRLVAIKVLEATQKDVFTRFRREAMAVARIAHPNVVQIHEIGFDARTPYIVMEYVAGGTASDLLNDPDIDLPLPWERGTRIAMTTARGLGAAHAAGIVHRDVKPANILLTAKDGDVAKVADFGIAKLQGMESLTREGSFVGTIGYLSPEQATGSEVDARSDVFSLGLTWYRLLTGVHAFRGTTAQVLRATVVQPCPDPRLIVPEIPPELAAILARMTALEPIARYADCSVVAAELESALRGLGASAPRSRSSPHAR
jgi:CHASE2 domain-containing sensor protein